MHFTMKDGYDSRLNNSDSSSGQDQLAHYGASWKFAEPTEHAKMESVAPVVDPSEDLPPEFEVPPAPPEDVITEEALSKMKEQELRTMAAQLGIAQIPKVRAELIGLIKTKHGIS
jgi:hypothetical protein